MVSSMWKRLVVSRFLLILVFFPLIRMSFDIACTVPEFSQVTPFVSYLSVGIFFLISSPGCSFFFFFFFNFCLWVFDFPICLFHYLVFQESGQFRSASQSCSTLCHPMDCSMPGFPVHHQFPELIQTHVHWFGDAIQTFQPLSSSSPPTFHLS